MSASARVQPSPSFSSLFLSLSSIEWVWQVQEHAAQVIADASTKLNGKSVAATTAELDILAADMAAVESATQQLQQQQLMMNMMMMDPTFGMDPSMFGMGMGMGMEGVDPSMLMMMMDMGAANAWTGQPEAGSGPGSP
jgi:hypothetical protein